MNWDKYSIGENAGIVWRTLSNDEMSWDELLKNTGLSSLELASAIGWLARENKINITSRKNIVHYSTYHESYF